MKTVNVSAAVICRKVNGKIQVFLAERCHGEVFGLEFPGGKIEKGESPAEAVIREIKEELLVEVKASEPELAVVEYDYPTFHLSMHLIECYILSGEIVLTEHASGQWVPISDLNSSKLKFAPADKKASEIVFEMLGCKK